VESSAIRNRSVAQSQIQSQPCNADKELCHSRAPVQIATIPTKTILYVNPMDDYMGIGSPRTNVTRYRRLAALPGIHVKAFDSRSALGESLWQKRVNIRLYSGQSVRHTNEALIAAVKEANPDYVFVDGDVWLYPSTLKSIKGQAGGKDDAAELPPVSVERGAAVAERDRLQLGQSVAAPGAAEGNRNVVVDQLAIAVGETCPRLLAAAGREPHDQAAVRQHGAANRGTAAADRIAG
jgi:hypothetical protein